MSEECESRLGYVIGACVLECGLMQIEFQFLQDHARFLFT